MEDCETDTTIYISHNTDEKAEAIALCDGAFEFPVRSRENYGELFGKMDRYADFIIAKGPSILGYAAMYANRPELGFAYLTLICIQPRYQGNHIGSRLLAECEGLARQRGFEKLRLEVKKTNRKALQFYTRTGFSRLDETEHSFFMEKSL